MPHDWLFEVERIIISLVPAYTLEMLDNCDIERLLPYYLFDYRKALMTKRNTVESGVSEKGSDEREFVIRNGKKYRVVNAEQATWTNSII